MAPTSTHGRFELCFHNWITQQHLDLDELLHALSSTSTSSDADGLRSLAEKSLNHFQDYLNDRAALVESLHAPSFLSPVWCTAFGNSFMWIGGCRPSLAIRLVYALSGAELEANLQGYFRGERKGNLGEISAQQLNLINALHSRTVGEEEKLSSKMATVQEDVADEPLTTIMKKSSQIGESSQEVDKALDAHALALGHMLSDADKLRLSTMKELIDILTPLQGVHFLVASKKLHLSIHEWGKKRDEVIREV